MWLPKEATNATQNDGIPWEKKKNSTSCYYGKKCFEEIYTEPNT